MRSSGVEMRVIDPQTEWEIVRGGDEDGPHTSGGQPIGLRCACCGRWALFGDDVDHAKGCEQAQSGVARLDAGQTDGQIEASAD